MKLRSLRRIALALAVSTAVSVGFLAPAARADTLPGGPWPAYYYSDGCGIAPINVLLDTHVFPDPMPWFAFPVSFRQVCDVHDAGYSGGLVYNPSDGRVLDLRSWSRAQVDNRFLADLQRACNQQVPPYALVALTSCHAVAVSYYTAVRAVGGARFDAAPGVPGVPTSGGTRANN